MQAYIGIRGAANSSQFADVPQRQDGPLPTALVETRPHRYPRRQDQMGRAPLSDRLVRPGRQHEHAGVRRFLLRRLHGRLRRDGEAQEPLVARMHEADRVRIVAPGTELEFSIKGIPVIPCWGERNIPDGEVFTAPVRDSINGTIRFNTQSRYQGTVFDNIEFEFKNGKIVRATANETEKINEILDSDEGARYCGEWAIGVNNRVRHPMLDTLFDEKIGGSFHLTPGNAYEIADNGNRSRIHWDLVQIQRPDYGGGEIWFDGELLRKDGRFVPAELQGLNEGL